MNYATNFAIVEDGVVTNIAWGMVYNMDEFPGAVQIDDRAVQIGDTYADGKFYHDGEEVITTSEQLAAALAALEEIEGALNNE